jgi:hypothetical protein
VQAGEDVPQPRNVVAVDRIARICHDPLGVPVLAELPLPRERTPVGLRGVVQQPSLAVGRVIAVGLDPEDVDVVAALVGIADVGLPAIGVGEIEAAGVPGGLQAVVEAVAAVEGVGEIAGRGHAGGPCIAEVANALDAQSSHFILPAMIVMPCGPIMSATVRVDRARSRIGQRLI